ncbi:MAG: EthD domain-containing protein, partial [Deltaproteobacteria bacterium]|nr:EthD domain-containing protein [Deltaproteobacteria bacterium]
IEEFHNYWSGHHAELVTKMLSKRRYVQCHTTHSAYGRTEEPAYDGVAMSWFEDTKIIKELSETPEYKAVRADESNFIDLKTINFIYAQEHIVKDGPIPENGLKVIICIKRKPGMDVIDFQKYWRDVHAPLGAKIPGSRRYVQNHTWLNYYQSGGDPIYDGVVESWFDNRNTLRKALNSPEHIIDQEDATNFIDVTNTPFLITKEIVITP